MNGKRMPRQVARTVLLVGEGDAEVLFMQHLKCMFVQRGSGVVVTLKNARGKGAAGVVDFAIRQSRNAAYDVKAVLLDTDTDWGEKNPIHGQEGQSSSDGVRALPRSGVVTAA